ncbi:MAG: cupin domain-containing protein [Pseudobacteriovorax sp.]|nr:cupin domain-containing protein [Pseudobacteriovorax sp.]
MTNQMTADAIIKKLELLPHPEGGYYRETYRSQGSIDETSLPDDILGRRDYGTAIYFLLTADQSSKFHRLKSDEIWHFHLGDGIEIVEICKTEKKPISIKMGQRIFEDETLQHCVAANTWFGARSRQDKESAYGFSLISCTVSPGFDFHDFELAGEGFAEGMEGLDDFRDLI